MATIYADPCGGDEAGYSTRADRAIGEEVDVIVEGRIVGQIAVAALLPAADGGGGDG